MVLRGINLLLILVAIISAFFLINKRYDSRTDYTMLNNLQTQAEELNREYTKLQLEEGTYSSNLVLQDFAVNKLGLIAPDNQHIVEIK